MFRIDSLYAKYTNTLVANSMKPNKPVNLFIRRLFFVFAVCTVLFLLRFYLAKPSSVKRNKLPSVICGKCGSRSDCASVTKKSLYIHRKRKTLFSRMRAGIFARLTLYCISCPDYCPMQTA